MLTDLSGVWVQSCRCTQLKLGCLSRDVKSCNQKVTGCFKRAEKIFARDSPLMEMGFDQQRTYCLLIQELVLGLGLDPNQKL